MAAQGMAVAGDVQPSFMFGAAVTCLHDCRFPKLRVCFAHGGGSFPCTWARIQHGFDVRPDLCAADCKVPPKEQIGRFWTDSLVHDADALDGIVKLFGACTRLGRRDCGAVCMCARWLLLSRAFVTMHADASRWHLWRDCLPLQARTRCAWAPTRRLCWVR